jgi:hypothetical protein
VRLSIPSEYQRAEDRHYVTVVPPVTVATLNYLVGHPALDRVAPTMTVAAVFRIQTIERFVLSTDRALVGYAIEITRQAADVLF